MSKKGIPIDQVDAFFERIKAEYARRLYCLCEIYFPYDRARREALYNDVLYRIWCGLPTFRQGSNLDAWLFCLAANTAADHRRRGRWRQIFRPLTPAVEQMAAEDDSDQQMLDELYRLIDSLEERDRRLTYLYLDKVPQSQIAEMLGMSVANVSTRIQRIKNKLKEMHDERERKGLY